MNWESVTLKGCLWLVITIICFYFTFVRNKVFLNYIFVNTIEMLNFIILGNAWKYILCRIIKNCVNLQCYGIWNMIFAGRNTLHVALYHKLLETFYQFWCFWHLLHNFSTLWSRVKRYFWKKIWWHGDFGKKPFFCVKFL